MRIIAWACALVICCSISIPSVCTADSGAAELRILVVDMQRAISDSIPGKAARADMEAEVRKSESRAAGLTSELDKMKAEIDKQAALLSPDALSEKRDEFEKRAQKVERELQDQREELTRKNDGVMRKVVKEVDQAVQEVAKLHGQTIIVEKDPRVVLYAAERLDITAEVVKKVDSKRL